MCTETKEDKIIFCIKNSYLPEDVKRELINYVKSHNDAAMRAAFRLGQMDMRESAAAALRDTAPSPGICKECCMEDANMIENLEVI